MAIVIAVGLLAPPLTNADRTVDIENGSFRGWAELQQRLNHPVAFGRGLSTGTSTGFASLAQLAGPVHKTGGVVFTYSIDGSYGGTRYFRGINLDYTSVGPGGSSWRYGQLGALVTPLPKDTSVPYAETYQSVGSGSFKLQMLKPPEQASDVLFYPGTLLKVDRNATLRSSRGNQAPPIAPGEKPATLDRLSVSGGAGGSYRVTTQYSTATEDQLRQAGTAYPDWLDPYRNFGGFYRTTPGVPVRKMRPSLMM